MRGVIVCGIAVHAVLLASIFHIYYTSPLTNGLPVEGVPSTVQPPADRLVLIVADGLRAHAFFDECHKRAPYLASIVHSPSSVWGVSHTAVPTESRPGHVAMAAGFTEDVSSVTKGWSENAVEFDTVFNRSTTTYAWGSPDIVPMFARGVPDGHVVTESYSSQEEDFASADPSNLDTWVFDKVDTFLKEITPEKNPEVHKSGVVYFLHLLGTDTNGHAHKPHSEAYLENMAVIDSGIRHLVDRMKSTFPDGRTVYMFTADHGMTDWGAHGAGTNHETYTPLVVWGGGQQSKQWRETVDLSSIAGLETNWWHGHRQRKDVEQIDLAPLMSSLIGVPVPTNNLGILPLAYMRSASVKYKYHAAHANYRQLHGIYASKRSAIKETSFKMFFRDYEELSPERLTGITTEIGRMVSARRYEVATEICLDTMPKFVTAAYYFHRYSRTMQSVCIVLIVVAWTGVLLAYQHTDRPPALPYRPSLITILLTVLLLLLLFIQSFTWPNYIYVIMPVLLVDYAVYMLNTTLNQFINRIRQSTMSTYGDWVTTLAAPLLFSMTYHNRGVLSVCLCAIAVWPHLSTTSRFKVPRALRLTWTLVCLVNALFPLLPTVGKEKASALFLLVPIIGVTVVWMVGEWVVKNRHDLDAVSSTKPKEVLSRRAKVISLVACITTSIALPYGDWSLSNGSGVPRIVCLMAWALLLILPVYLVAVIEKSRLVSRRSLHICLSVLPFYTLLSLTHEAYFLVAFIALLTTWTIMEMYLTDDAITVHQRLRLVDFDARSNERAESDVLTTRRRACIYVLFALHAFFGTGNMASINSFDPSMVRLFATVFAPWLMMSLLIIKLLVPQLLLAVAVHAQQRLLVRKDRQDVLHVNVLLITDLITLLCFFQLRDEGSWLDIGQSISHYLLSAFLTVVLIVLRVVAAWITTATLDVRSVYAKLKVTIERWLEKKKPVVERNTVAP